MDLVEMIGAMAMAVQQVCAGPALQGVDEIVWDLGRERVQTRGGLEGESRQIGGGDPRPVRVERLVG
jgi:hypothetical protein